jgi:3-oxoacyl-[acyl-carrier-protein] synthase II
MSRRRVVITGMGMVSPLGNTVEETWKNILASKSGIARIEHFDPTPFTTHFAGNIKNFDVEKYLPLKDARKMDIFIQYGLAAGIQAMEDSGLVVTEQNADRIGVAIGSGIGGIGAIEENRHVIDQKGPRRISPFFVPGSIINMVSGNLAIKYGFKGPNIAIVTACTTGTHNIGFGLRMIQNNEADVIFAGGAEMACTEVGLGGFAAARALSQRNDNPHAASRPWDKDRDGFVLADGAGVLAIEEYEHAKRRGAKIYAEVSGFGMSDDAFHMTSPPEDGSGAATAMRNALRDAALPAERVHYINAHGTSTQAGDRAECRAVKNVMGAASSQVAVSSTKSMVGHLLGAAGAVEAIFSVLAIRDQVAPPTINLEHPDEGCDLNFVPQTPQSMKIDCAMSNSFGFGGTNGTLVFSKI